MRVFLRVCVDFLQIVSSFLELTCPGTGVVLFSFTFFVSDGIYVVEVSGEVFQGSFLCSQISEDVVYILEAEVKSSPHIRSRN